MTFSNPNDPNNLNNRQNRRLPDGGRGYGGAAGWWIGALIIVFIVFVSWGGWGWGGWGWNQSAVHTTNTAVVNHTAPAPRTNGGG